MKIIYSLIGEILENLQYIEHNLVLSITYVKLKHLFDEHNVVSEKRFYSASDDAKILQENMKIMSLGNIVNVVIDAKFLDELEIETLKGILKKRNNLIHHYFKENNFLDQSNNVMLENEQSVYLSKFLQEVVDFNTTIAIKHNILNEWYEGLLKIHGNRIIETVEVALGDEK